MPEDTVKGAPDAPVAAEEGTGPEQPVEGEGGPAPTSVRESLEPDRLSRADLHHKAADIARSRAEELQRSREQARDDKGRFAAGESADVQPSGGEQTPADGDAAEGKSASPTGQPPPADGMVRIALPEGHPLRDQGHSYLDVPEADEAVYRSQLNNPVRANELERLKTQWRNDRAELARLRAELDAMRDPEIQKLQLTPELEVVLNDLEQQYGPEQAKLFRDGIEAQRQRALGQKAESAMAEERGRMQAHQLLSEIRVQAARRYPVWAGDGALFYPDGRVGPALADAIQMFGRMVDSGAAQPTAEEFFLLADREYIRDPRARQQVSDWQQKQHEERITSLVEERVNTELEKLKTESASARARHGTKNPMGGWPNVATGTRTPSPAGEGQDSMDDLTPAQTKRLLTERARENARTGT
ncbi:hypothetical protein [Candidatus Palauibacter sp.]|uniref:hypothetical protein n=1 Tax=Candidatus Palauibacter sp. TaxID=3101350 RepID=UPI003CC50816